MAKVAQLIHASFDPNAPDGDMSASGAAPIDYSYLGAMELGARMLAAEEALSARIDDLIGEGILLDADKLRALVREIERSALPAAEAYEALLSEAAPWECPNCKCAAPVLCSCPCHDVRGGDR
ncbi:MAG: hypothetical protein ACRDJF_08740 [Actinomycetota bacterium]